jgi:hypothetical protein
MSLRPFRYWTRGRGMRGQKPAGAGADSRRYRDSRKAPSPIRMVGRSNSRGGSSEAPGNSGGAVKLWDAPPRTAARTPSARAPFSAREAVEMIRSRGKIRGQAPSPEARERSSRWELSVPSDQKTAGSSSAGVSSGPSRRAGRDAGVSNFPGFCFAKPPAQKMAGCHFLGSARARRGAEQTRRAAAGPER